MRRIAVLAGACLALALVLIAPGGASAAFTQCPPVELNASCQFLVTVTDTEKTVESDPTQGPYEGADDALIGVQNNSSSPISSIALSAENELFGFEFDGICSVLKPAPGCQVLPRFQGGAPTAKPKDPCPPATEACGFPSPAGEPSTVTFPPGIGIVGEGEPTPGVFVPVTGYEGPTSWFTNIAAFGSSSTGSGVVNFSPAIPPGGSTYFSLESPPAGGFGSSSSLTTVLSGGGQAGPSISVLQGTAVTDTATLGGAGAASATGPVSFNVFSDPGCTKLAAAAGIAKLAGGTAGPSAAVSLAPGTYYWQAHYAGSLAAQSATSACGSEILTVRAPTTTSTIQTGGGVTGASIPVLVGSKVTDKAHIAGPLAASATGAVSYVLFKDKKCTVPAASGSVAVVGAGGNAGPSAAIKPKAGTYYWVASYSGDALNAPSSSPCGSEVLIVSTKANFHLPSSRKCASKRRFTVHPKGPSNLVRVQVFVNGKFTKEAHLRKGGTVLSLIGLPKGTFRVAFVAYTSSGKTFEDTRTFHTCIPKIRVKHKKHH